MEDLAYIIDEISHDADKEGEDEDVEFSEEEETAYISGNVFDTHKNEEISLANNAFAHGRSLCSDMEAAMASMNRDLAAGEETIFKGIMIDTCANRSSVMSISQYKAYCGELSVPVSLDTS